MADIQINPNSRSPDGDDEADRIEKKRLLQAEQRATSEKRASVFKQSMQQQQSAAALPDKAQPTTQNKNAPAAKPANSGAAQASAQGASDAPSSSASGEQATTGQRAGRAFAGASGANASNGQPAAGTASSGGTSAGTGATLGSVSSDSSEVQAPESTTQLSKVGGRSGSQSGTDDQSARDSDSGSDLKPRIDAAAIAPAFPTPTTRGHAPIVATPPPAGVNVQMLEQLVQFAAVGKTKEGLSEFRLGIGSGPLAGMHVCLTSCGRRRVKMRFAGVNTDALSEDQINQLVSALSGRNVEVVEVDID